MTKGETGSRLCTAVAVILLVMPAFGSAALAQQAQTSVRSWTGQIDWRISFPTGRMWGRLDLTFDADGQGNLKGRMTGDDHVEAQTPCGPTTTQTPSKLSANLVGQYAPGRNTMSLRVAEPQIEQGQFSMCAIAPGGGYQRLSGQPFGGGGPLGQPVLAQLLNSLTVRADGSVEASGEGPVAPASPAPTTLHVKLKLTLRGGDCLDNLPDSGFVFYTGPGGAHSEPSMDSPRVAANLYAGRRLMFTGKTRGLNGETWFQARKPDSPGWPQVEIPATVWVPASAVSCVRPPASTGAPSSPLPPRGPGDIRTLSPNATGARG